MPWKTVISSKAKNKFSFIYAALLFILLVSVSFPSLSYPPLSDYWEIFYFFHHLDQKPGAIKWLHILNHDPFEHMRYQPLSRVFFYTFHLLFGSNFILFNILNLLFYFSSALFLYKFALVFSQNKTLAFAFIGLFVFLFSHFDIVLWSCHIYIIASFSLFLIGFMAYLKYLKTAKPFLLSGVIVLLLLGMFCYEPFFLWPFAIVILSRIKSLRPEKGPGNKTIAKSQALVLSVIYALYFLFYLFTRSLGTYEKPLHEVSKFLKTANFLSSGFLTLFNFFYNNIIVNIFPFLPFPLKVTENIYMSGPVVNYIAQGHKEVIFIGGALVGVLLISSLVYLYRRRLSEELKIISLFLFLMLSETYILFFCRLVTDDLWYSLTEFRYQYIPNAFIILIAIFIVDRFCRAPGCRKIIYPLLALILVFNIFCIRRVVNIYNYHFAPLNTMLFNIKTGISNGTINQDRKLYIDKDMPDYLPHLCWNIELGESFISRGNYQWMFSRREIGYFADNLEDAVWVINKDDLSLAKKNQPGISQRAKRINAIKDRWYIAWGKDQKYFELGTRYKENGKYRKSDYMFKRALLFNPSNTNIYDGLGALYAEQGKYPEAEEMFKKILEINPEDPEAFLSLANLYKQIGDDEKAVKIFLQLLELIPNNAEARAYLAEFYSRQGKYPEAEEMFKKILEINPEDDRSYAGLGHLYNSQNRYPEAEEMFKKAIRLNPNNASAYDGLGALYANQKKYSEAEEMYKRALELNPYNDVFYADLGHLYNSQNRYQEAEEMFGKALKINPKNNEAYNALEDCYKQQGKK